MKSHRFMLALLILMQVMVFTSLVDAQNLQTLSTFTNGINPNGLTLGSGGDFYGSTEYGGITNSAHPIGFGTVFKAAPNGTLTTLASFSNSEGANPVGPLTVGNDGNFYGTTVGGGNAGDGTVFRVTTNGILTTLVSFTGNNGSLPEAALTLGNDGNFYGTTTWGGINGVGTVFKVTTNGSLISLVSFDGSNGKYPVAPLTQGNDGNFYGTTSVGGNAGDGTVFRVTTNGTLTTLVSFTNATNPNGITLGNDGNFYGTIMGGGLFGDGTVFRVTTNGILTTLISFSGTNGINPSGALTLGKDGNFYGTTWGGGSADYGTVFQITTKGTLTTLASFTNSNEANPSCALTIGSDGNLYGTTENAATVFRLLLPQIPPFIISQPQTLIVTNGCAAIFSVVADGLPLLAYQWQFNGTNLSGATNTTLTMPNAFLDNGGAYSVVITNTYGSITSNPIFLKVLPLGITAPTILASGQFQFSFDTVIGVKYAVQYSTNLTQWFPFVTLDGVGMPLTLIDPNAELCPIHFYRINLSPQ